MRTTLLFLSIFFSCALLGCSRAPAGSGSVTVDTKNTNAQVVTYTPVGAVKDATHGKEVFLSYGQFNGVAQTPANGIGSLHVFEDGYTNIGIQLNIRQPEEGKFYEAWALRKDTPPSAWISLGHLYSVTGDVRHALKSGQSKDLRNYTILRVTSEADDGNVLPSADVVAETLLKTANRTVK